MAKLEELPAVIEAADTYNLTSAAYVHTLRATCVDGQASEAELLSCILVSHQHGLNPLLKEIYFMKTKAGKIQPIVSVDGWIKMCNTHPQFDGFEFADTVDNKGVIVAIACTIHRKDRRPTAVTEYLSECKGQGGPWKSHPSRMLRHRALIQCARLAFGFGGIMDHDEFKVWQEFESTNDNADEGFIDITAMAETANGDEDGDPVGSPQGDLYVDVEAMAEAVVAEAVVEADVGTALGWLQRDGSRPLEADVGTALFEIGEETCDLERALEIFEDALSCADTEQVLDEIWESWLPLHQDSGEYVGRKFQEAFEKRLEAIKEAA